MVGDFLFGLFCFLDIDVYGLSKFIIESIDFFFGVLDLRLNLFFELRLWLLDLLCEVTERALDLEFLDFRRFLYGLSSRSNVMPLAAMQRLISLSHLLSTNVALNGAFVMIVLFTLLFLSLFWSFDLLFWV